MSKSRYTRLSISFLRDYVSKNGNVTFVYSVDGSPAGLQAYADAQAEHLVIDDETGKHLWFNINYVGERATLLVNSDNGKCFPDVSEFRKQASLAKQFGPAIAAQSALGKLFSGKPAEAPASVDKR